MILEGKTLAASLRAPLAQRADAVRRKLGRPISLFAAGSTEDYGAYVYLKKEVQAAEKLGVRTQVHELNNATRAEEFLNLLQKVSADPDIDAILIPRPLPPALAQSGFTRYIAPEKDIDGMSNTAMGNLFLCKSWQDVQALPTFVPCTALAGFPLLGPPPGAPPARGDAPPCPPPPPGAPAPAVTPTSGVCSCADSAA